MMKLSLSKKVMYLKIAPQGERCIKADDKNAIKFMCIQVKENSLDTYTETDGVILEKQPQF